MENKASLIKRGTKECLTRLQKHAPASLEINEVLGDRPTNPFAPSGEASKAIPLLSPLTQSPQTFYAERETTTIQAHTSQNSGSNNGGSISNGSTPSTGWKHPAMAPFSEPSSLCSFLQKQCVIVNNTQ